MSYVRDWANKVWDEKIDMGWGEGETFRYIIRRLDPILTDALRVMKATNNFLSTMDYAFKDEQTKGEVVQIIRDKLVTTIARIAEVIK